MSPIVSILCTLIFMNYHCLAVELPCEFSFDPVKGYTCRVFNYTNTQLVVQVTKVLAKQTNEVGQHFYKNPEISVTNVVMWNLDVHYIPGNLSSIFPYMKSLQVKSCGLKNLTRGEEFHALRKMYFGFNEIEHVPVNYFWHFCKLEILSLFGNKISGIPKLAFSDLISLRRLSLNHNRIRSLDMKLFHNCTNLEFIDLDNNLLEFIGNNLFENLRKLSHIHLRHNRLRFIGKEFLGSLPSLKFANLKGNVCIDDIFPGKPPNRQSLKYLQSIFLRSCSVPSMMTSTTKKPYKEPIRGKPKYEPQKPIYYFKNCKWQTPSEHRYF